MVKHVLMIKLKEDCKDKAEELKTLFLSMRGRVPQALEVESGVRETAAAVDFEC